jgi:hypothetical protein
MLDFLAGVPGKLKTLLDRLTATRATNLDNLDAAISTRVSSSVWTNALAAELDGLAPAIAALPASFVNSIQHKTGTVTGTSASATVTITGVTTAKTVLIMLGWYDNGSQATPVHIALTNTTTVTISRAAPGASTITYVSFIVLEFK